MKESIHFTASAISGAGRGKELGVPTINVDLSAVPEELEDGIYACTVLLEPATDELPAAMHYGPRPVFDNSRSCEVHLLDAVPPQKPTEVTITVVERIRDIQNFESPEAMVEEIGRDVEKVREALSWKS